MLFLLIILVLIIVVTHKMSHKKTHNYSTSTPASTATRTNPVGSISNPQLDQNIIDNIVFLYSVAIELGSTHNKFLMNNAVNHGWVRCAAGDYNGKGYVSFSGSTFNVYKGQTEFREFIQNKTLDTASKFLNAAGFSSARASDFIKYGTLAQITYDTSLGLNAKYEVSVPNGMGNLYYEKIKLELQKKWPYSNFEFDLHDIDLTI